MKRFYFFIATIALALSVFAQSEGSAKIYAYRQNVLPGTVRVNENGRSAPSKPQYNYYIYLVSSNKISAVEIYMNGQAYKVSTTEISKTPVEYKNPTFTQTTGKILVPKTSKKVLQLTITSDAVAKPNAKAKNLSSKKDLVVTYKSGNKLYYKTVSKFSELEPLAMQ